MKPQHILLVLVIAMLTVIGYSIYLCMKDEVASLNLLVQQSFVLVMEWGVASCTVCSSSCSCSCNWKCYFSHCLNCSTVGPSPTGHTRFCLIRTASICRCKYVSVTSRAAHAARCPAAAALSSVLKQLPALQLVTAGSLNVSKQHSAQLRSATTAAITTSIADNYAIAAAAMPYND
eukprot:4791-Heterococcus_DN1.PRE.3